MFGQAFRLEPAGRPSDYRTFGITLPQYRDHQVPASCAQVGCEAHEKGWVTRVPVGSDLDALVRASGRRWAAVVQDGAELVYTFPPGTDCFRASTHRRVPQHPGIFTVRDGDHRGYSGSPRTHQRPEDWVEDLQEHTERIRALREKG